MYDDDGRRKIITIGHMMDSNDMVKENNWYKYKNLD